MAKAAIHKLQRSTFHFEPTQCWRLISC